MSLHQYTKLIAVSQQSWKNVIQLTTCSEWDTVQGTPETHHRSGSCHGHPRWHRNLYVQIQRWRWLAIIEIKIWYPTLKVYVTVPQKKYRKNIEQNILQWQQTKQLNG
jgi:hypothetical protein